MIYSQEVILLFIGTLLAASLVIFTLYGQITSGSGQVSSIGIDIQRSVSSSFSIISVSERNIYVRGISGELNVSNTVITLNGAPLTYTVTFLRDGGSNHLLDPEDLVVLNVDKNIGTGDCLLIDIDGVAAQWGVCR